MSEGKRIYTEIYKENIYKNGDEDRRHHASRHEQNTEQNNQQKLNTTFNKILCNILNQYPVEQEQE